jgi:hypothetical protein
MMANNDENKEIKPKKDMRFNVEIPQHEREKTRAPANQQELHYDRSSVTTPTTAA